MQDTESDAAGELAAAYEAPTITRLGTLAELTLGGSVGPDDGLGGNGDVGTFSV